MYKKLLPHFLIYLQIIVGTIITALAINAFLVPNKIAAGGVTGLATVIYYIFGYPVGTVMLVINVPLFLLGFRELGGHFGIRTIFSTILLSLVLDFTSFIPPFTTDLLLASVYGGFTMGIGLALVFRSEATTGGSDLAAKIIHKYSASLTVAKVLLIVDFFVIVIAGIAFKNHELMLYALVTIFISSRTIDLIIEGVNYSKVAIIITNRPNEIAHLLLTELERGVTGLDGRGMFTGSVKNVLLCVLKSSEILKLKRIVKKVDDDSFIILTDAKEVLGEGFKK